MGEDVFDSRTTQYRPENALLLAKAALLAYQSPESIKPEVEKWGCSQFAFIDRKDTQVFLTGNSEMILVAFRGTEPQTLQDWMTDARVKRKSDLMEKSIEDFYKRFNRSGLKFNKFLTSGRLSPNPYG